MSEENAAHMASYWDARARENAMYFVDNRLDYNHGDEAAFWREGVSDLDRMLAGVGASVGSADTALDIGCGVGRLTRALADRAAHVHGIDVSGEMLTRARTHLAGRPNVTFHQGDGTSLSPLADGSVDLVVSLVVFQHIPDPVVTLGYIREIGRVLRPGGRAVFQVSEDPSVHAPVPSRGRLKAALGRAPRGQDDPAWRGSAVAGPDLERAVADGGMRIVRRTGEGTQFLIVRTEKLPPD